MTAVVTAIFTLAIVLGSLALVVFVGAVALATWVFLRVDLSEDLGGDRWEDL